MSQFQLGRVKLRKDDRQTAVFRQIFDCVIMTETNLRQQISDLQSDNERLASERTRAQQVRLSCNYCQECHSIVGEKVVSLLPRMSQHYGW